MNAKEVAAKIPQLTKGQLFWIGKVIGNYSFRYESRLFARTLLTGDPMLQYFGDALRTHHAFSQEPCSKDKFEYILEQTIKNNGGTAELAPRGNPGHDITIGGVAMSLKSQANVGISPTKIWISKFHELGRGEWTDQPAQLVGLRAQYLEHLTHYERIFTLRCLQREPNWKYQLVEIPKELLARASTGRLEMKLSSTQTPKPGYCYVTNAAGTNLFSLYFDGGTERKLQIKDLLVSECVTHAEWGFYAPKLIPATESELSLSDGEPS